jgi:4-amino-4-deoxy-L-arabinose transferase-like glycosyltransferase
VALAWLAAALVVPLFPDEYYYWTWSQHLAAGYFDHPPAVAWLIGAGTTLFGTTPFGVRAFTLACGLLTLTAVGRLAARLAGPAAAPRAMLLFAVTPLITGAFVLATPDAPLLAATTWSLYAILRAIEADNTPRQALGWWSMAGVLLGVAGLSKYTAVLVPAALALTLALHRPLRRVLATPGPYLAAVLALVLVSPVVAWNAGHGWVSFRYQLSHGLGAPRGGSLLDREVTMVSQQLLAATPILLAFLVAAVWRTLRRRIDPRAVLLGGVALCVALFFAWSGRRRPVEANWLALAYPAATVLLASWPLEPRAARWLRAGAWLSAALTLVLLTHLATPLLPLPREPLATSQAFGWPAVGGAVERAAAASGGDGALHFATNRYQDAAAVSFLLPTHPPVYAFNLNSRRNQYDLWPQFPDVARPGDRMLLLLNEDGSDPQAVLGSLAPHFASIEQGELVERRMPALDGRGEMFNRKRIWLLSGWRGTWPDEARRGR